jgi:hypothetical protein
MAKISVSQLTKKSQIMMAKRISLDDLKVLAQLSSDAQYGKATVEEYRKVEAEMIEKYHFVVK